MSTPDKSGSNDLGIDLDLHFLPAWAQRSSTENKYAKFQGGEDSRERGGPRPFRDRPPRREGDRGPRPPRAEGAPGPRREGGRLDGGKFGYRGPRRDDRREERRDPLPPPLQIEVSLIPEEKGVEALARQIRLTGRAYPLFDIAHLILKKPDRYDVRYKVIKDKEGKPVQPLFLCALDDTLWPSEQEAVNYVLDKHFATLYQSEKIPTDPPKGVYTFVAQCGMSNVILGPPNYHDYQNKLRKLHAERFARMPFEMFKSRVKIVKDEAVVKKWIEEQSFKTEYTCLNVPEALKLQSREEVEKHFRETHLPNVIKSIEFHSLSGTAALAQAHRGLQLLVRWAWEDQTRFPLKVVNVLSGQFAGHGLHFFKVNKNVTHVSVARPHYLDLESTPVSDGIKRIVEFIRDTASCTRKKILEALAPAPAPSPEVAPAPPAEGSAPAPATEPPPSPEAAVVNGDLHWLIHQGHVIEFANGVLELAKKPAPRPPKPEPKPAEPAAPAESKPVEASPDQTPVSAEASQSSEVAAASSDENTGTVSVSVPPDAVASGPAPEAGAAGETNTSQPS